MESELFGHEKGAYTGATSNKTGWFESANGGPLEQALLELFESNKPDLYEHVEEVLFRTANHFCPGNQLQTGRLLGISTTSFARAWRRSAN